MRMSMLVGILVARSSPSYSIITNFSLKCLSQKNHAETLKSTMAVRRYRVTKTRTLMVANTLEVTYILNSVNSWRKVRT